MSEWAVRASVIMVHASRGRVSSCVRRSSYALLISRHLRVRRSSFETWRLLSSITDHASLYERIVVII